MDSVENLTTPIEDTISKLLDLHGAVEAKRETLETVFGNGEFLSGIGYQIAHLILDIAGVPAGGTPMPESYGADHFVRDVFLDVPWGYLRGRLTKQEVMILLINWNKFDDLQSLWAKF